MSNKAPQCRPSASSVRAKVCFKLGGTSANDNESGYSDHIAIEKNIRERFFDAIEAAINRHGGSVSVFDTIDLQLAGKPSPSNEAHITGSVRHKPGSGA